MKVPLEQTRASQGAQGVCGVLGATKEHKKEELVAYINSAKQLVHKYIPLTREKIEAATSNGYMSAQVLEPGRKVSPRVTPHKCAIRVGARPWATRSRKSAS